MIAELNSFIKLDDNNVVGIIGKKIYCIEKSISYLNELSIKFPNLKISGIFDDYKRNQGEFVFNDTRIWVKDLDAINDLDFSECVLIITSDYYKEAYEKLQVLKNKPEVIYFFVNNETEIELKYREKYKNDLFEDMIIFRSGPHALSYVKGMDFADNARALFEYMLSIGMNNRYKLVWFVKNPEKFSEYSRYNNVEFISFDWSVNDNKENLDKYYYALCHAKYLFFTDAYGFARNCSPDQVRVQLWHGCGFKTRVNFVRCEKRYEYTTVVSDLYAKIHADIYGLRDNQVLVTGYAKEDWLFHPVDKEKLKDIGIPDAKKYLFWLPTFRSTDKKLEQLNEYSVESEVGLPIVDSFEKLKILNDILIGKDMVLVVKLHPFQSVDSINCGAFSNIRLLDNGVLADNDIQINQLLGYADALISDYSSAAVDYLLLNRPIAFTLDDVDEYENSRGFVFDDIRSMLPGKEIYQWDDFIQYVVEIGNGVDLSLEKRSRIRSHMHNFYDDKSCERILEALKIL